MVKLVEGKYNPKVVAVFCRLLPPVVADALIVLHLKECEKNPNYLRINLEHNLRDAILYGFNEFIEPGSILFRNCVGIHGNIKDFDLFYKTLGIDPLDPRLAEDPITLEDRLKMQAEPASAPVTAPAIEPMDIEAEIQAASNAEDTRDVSDDQPDLGGGDQPGTDQPLYIEGLWKLYEGLASQNTSAFDAIMHDNGDGTVRMYRREEFVHLVKNKPAFVAMLHIVIAESNRSSVINAIWKKDSTDIARHKQLLDRLSDVSVELKVWRDESRDQAIKTRQHIDAQLEKQAAFHKQHVNDAAAWTTEKILEGIAALYYRYFHRPKWMRISIYVMLGLCMAAIFHDVVLFIVNQF